MDCVRKELIFGTEEVGSFRYCGTEIEQDRQTFEITLSCKHTSERLSPISIPAARASDPSSPVTHEEREQLMSIVGSLMWICRCCRPGLSYGVSRLQSMMPCATIEEVKLANKLVKIVLESLGQGLVFKPVIPWPSHPGEPVRMCLAAVSDASHGNESEYQDDWKVRENFRSQGGKLVFLADQGVRDGEKAHVHLISFGSTVIKRVVSSTIKAETYQLSDVVESADVLRVALADAHGAITNPDKWESESAAWMPLVWFTDCRSCYDTLQKPVSKSVDKRLGMELASLRQHLWRQRGSEMPDPRSLEDRPLEPTDIVRWVDTSVMVADCLTKAMREEFLLRVLESNLWDFAQPESAREVKLRKQQQRSKTWAEDAEDE
jgi:hypothetical protein